MGRTILGGVVLIAGLVVACSDNEGEQSVGDAGSAGEAGKSDRENDAGAGGTDSAQAGASGAGGAPANTCVVQTLDSLCADHDCPETPEAVFLECGFGIGGERWATDCGGTAVSSSDSSGTFVYFFDAQDELVGAQRFDNNLIPTCRDHGRNAAAAFGTTCTLTDPVTDRCEEACPTRPLADWCDDNDCPSTEAEARSCAVYSDSREVWDNDCGGVNVADSLNYVGTVWSYDATGQLVGAQNHSDVASYCGEISHRETFGDYCELAGDPTLICLDSPTGEGGAGGGGGGAP